MLNKQGSVQQGPTPFLLAALTSRLFVVLLFFSKQSPLRYSILLCPAFDEAESKL